MNVKSAVFAIVLASAAFQTYSARTAAVAPPPAPEIAVLPDDLSSDDLTSTVVTYAGHEIIPQGKCQYFHQKAIETSDREWWVKYQKCEQG